jgi:hypothetical protein
MPHPHVGSDVPHLRGEQLQVSEEVEDLGYPAALRRRVAVYHARTAQRRRLVVDRVEQRAAD